MAAIAHIIPKSWGLEKKARTIVVVCWVVYAVLSFMSPRSTSRSFNLPGWETVLLQLTILVPLYFIWTTAINGAVTFKHYAHIIKGGREAPGISQIANGLFWLVGYAYLVFLTSVIVPYFVHSPLLGTAVIIKNHLPAWIALIAFYLIYQGSARLRDVAQFTTWSRVTPWLAVAFALFAGAFTMAFAYSPVDMANRGGIPAYSAPPNVLLFTLVLPSLATWFMGILATVNIIKYATFVKGFIYKLALRRLVWGIWSVLFFAVVLQGLIMMAPFLNSLGLGVLLLIIYAILILYGLGFMLIRSGARKLTRIEVIE